MPPPPPPPRLLLLLLASASAALPGALAACVSIPAAADAAADGPFAFASACAPLLGYGRAEAAAGAECPAALEARLGAWKLAASSVGRPCGGALLRYYCAATLRPCGEPEGVAGPPPAAAEAVRARCSAEERGTVAALAAALGADAAWDADALPSDAASTASFASAEDDAAEPLPLPRCVEYPAGGVCAGMAPAEVYERAPGAVAAAEEALAAGARALFVAAERERCLPALALLVCAAAFPPCDRPLRRGPPGALPAPLERFAAPFPSLPARRLCTEAAAACAGSGVLDSRVAAALGFGGGACNATAAAVLACGEGGRPEPAPGAAVPLFGDAPSALVPGLAAAPRNEMNGSAALAAAAEAGSDAECPPPLVRPQNPGATATLGGGQCALPCPSLLYSNAQYDKSDRLLLVLSFVGLVSSAFQLATFALFKRARRSRATIFFTAHLFVVSLVLFVSVGAEARDGTPAQDGPFARVRCLDNARPSREGVCVFQATFMVYSSLSAVAWWFVQAADIFLQVQFRARTWMGRRAMARTVGFAVWAWGYPACVTVALLAAEQLGNASNGTPWCFILDSDLAWGVFYGPVFAQTVFGAAFMLLIVRKICVSSRNTGGARRVKSGISSSTSASRPAASGRGRRSKFAVWLRPLLFVGFFTWVWLFIFAYRFNEHGREDEYRRDAGALVACLLAQPDPATAAEACAALGVAGPQPNEALWYLIQATVALVGFWGMLLYLSLGNLARWRRFLLCRGRDEGSAEKYLSSGGGGGGGSGPRSTSGGVPKSSSSSRVTGGRRAGPGASKELHYAARTDDSSGAVAPEPAA